MVFDKNKKITKEEYCEELVKEIKGVDEARDYICKNFSRPFECYVEYCKLGKIRMDYIEKLYNIDNSEE